MNPNIYSLLALYNIIEQDMITKKKYNSDLHLNKTP